MAQPTTPPAADPPGGSAPPAQPVEYGRARGNRGWKVFALARMAVAAAALLALAAMSYQRFTAPAPPGPPAAPQGIINVPAVAPSPARPAESERARITRVYRQDIVPLLDQYDARNRAAADRAIATLRERIEARRGGIKPFVDDVQSWGTTFGVIRRKTRDAVRRDDPRGASAVQKYVDVKFRRHVMTPLGLMGDVDAALTVFREDVAASRNQLYAEVRLPLAGIKVEQVRTDETFEAFLEDVQERAQALGRSGSTDAVVSNLTAFAAGWVAGEVGMKVGSRVTGMVVTRVGAQLAARAAVSGGATVTGAASGGTAGSAVGPAGTVVGLAVGVAVGAAVDWWMSEKFEARMTGQLNAFLTDLQRTIVEGTPAQPGLRASFDAALESNSKIQRQAMIDTLLKETPEP